MNCICYSLSYVQYLLPKISCCNEDAVLSKRKGLKQQKYQLVSINYNLCLCITKNVLKTLGSISPIKIVYE